jgi:hypothetical protein
VWKMMSRGKSRGMTISKKKKKNPVAGISSWMLYTVIQEYTDAEGSWSREWNDREHSAG